MVTEESQLKYLYLKLKPQRFQETLKFVEMTWKKFIPSRPFDFSFLDERLDNLYSQEKQLRKIFAVFSGLAVFISCLGLFGLASFVSEQRTREIGIRKILGASTGNIVKLLVKDFTKLVIYAALISFPIAYYVMRNWLEHFPYRIELTVSPFIFGSGVAFGIALLTVSYKALMTALTDPVEALRHE
jgi:putative ABC transport system permease protein